MLEPNLLLSLEEFGCSLLLLNDLAALSGWLQAHGITWDENETRARFSAAARTLIMRGLARLNPDGALVLDDHLARILRTAAHPHYSLSFARVDAQRAEQCAYHVDAEGNSIVYQAWRPEGGYALAQVPLSHQYLVAQAVDFFQITNGSATKEVWEVPIAHLDNPQAANDLPDPLRTWLSDDYKHERMRGTISRVDYAEGAPVSNYACLILSSPWRTWVSRLLPEEKKARIRLASREAFEEELRLLMEQRYTPATN